MPLSITLSKSKLSRKAHPQSAIAEIGDFPRHISLNFLLRIDRLENFPVRQISTPWREVNRGIDIGQR